MKKKDDDEDIPTMEEQLRRMVIRTPMIEPSIPSTSLGKGDRASAIKAALGRVLSHQRGTQMGKLILEASIFQDSKSTDEIIEITREWFIATTNKRHRARLKNSGYLTSTIALALYETLGDGNCPGCHGRGSVRKGSLWAICHFCSGMRKTTPREGTRAKMAGIPRDQWYRLWGARCQRIKAKLEVEKAIALQIVEAELGRGRFPRLRRG